MISTRPRRMSGIGCQLATVPAGFGHEPWLWFDNPLPAPLIDHKAAFRETRAPDGAKRRKRSRHAMLSCARMIWPESPACSTRCQTNHGNRLEQTLFFTSLLQTGEHSSSSTGCSMQTCSDVPRSG